MIDDRREIGEEAAADLTCGRVPHPPFRDHRIDKPVGAGWDDRGPRRIVGTCIHRMDGTLVGTENYLSTPGDHGWFALTDYGIGNGLIDGSALDGVIFRWNDPHGMRTPWASGWGTDGPVIEGDGQGFVDAYGVPAINRDLASIELSGDGDTPLTAGQLESLCQLVAYWHDQAGVPWHFFPRDPASGVVTQLYHGDFARKDCPGEVVRSRTDEFRARAKEILRQYQERREPAEPIYPPGMDRRRAEERFGRVVTDGRTDAFDPRDPVGNAWLEHGRQTGHFPTLIAVDLFAGSPNQTRKYFRFDDGTIIFATGDGTAHVMR